MLIDLLLQAVTVPLLLSLGVTVITAQRSRLAVYTPVLLALAWLPSYGWIVQWPNMPPRLIHDWYGPLVLLLCLGFVLSRLTRYALGGVAAVAMLVIAWPVLRHPQVFSNEVPLVWQLCVIISGLWAYTVKQPPQHYQVGNTLLILAAVGLGIATILAGSLSLGLLSISLGITHGVASVWGLLQMRSFDDRILLVLLATLLLSTSIYVELHWVLTLGFWLTLVVSRHARITLPGFSQPTNTLKTTLLSRKLYRRLSE